MTLLKAITNDSYVDSKDSASLSQGSVSEEAHSGGRAIPR